jgi:hypothetical protein
VRAPAFAVGAVLLASTCLAGEESLCAAGEVTRFSCYTGKKFISLCSSQSAGGASANVRYLFGRPGAIELSYPLMNRPSPATFYTGSLIYSQGGTTYVRFLSGSYEYIIYSNQGAAGERGWLKEGLVVAKSDQHVAHVRCRQSNPAQSGWRDAAGASEQPMRLAHDGTQEHERVEMLLLRATD